MSLLRTHDASVHRILKLLASITPCRVQSSLSCSDISPRKRILQFPMQMDLEVPSSRHRSCLSSWHSEHQCSDLAAFPGLHHCSSSGFLQSPNEPNTVHLCDLLLTVSSLLYLQVALPECESGRYSRVIHLGRKSSVDGKLGAFSLVLGQTHTDSKFLLGTSIGALVVKVACK